MSRVNSKLAVDECGCGPGTRVCERRRKPDPTTLGRNKLRRRRPLTIALAKVAASRNVSQPLGLPWMEHARLIRRAKLRRKTTMNEKRPSAPSQEQRRTILAPHDRNGGGARRYAARRPFRVIAGFGWRMPSPCRHGTAQLVAGGKVRDIPWRRRATARGKNSWCSFDIRSTTQIVPSGRGRWNKS